MRGTAPGAGRSRQHPAASGGTRCRTLRREAHWERGASGSDRLERGRVVKRSQVDHSASSTSIASSMGAGSEKRSPPWTMRCPTATTSGASARSPIARDVSSSATTLSLRLVDPALTTRTSPVSTATSSREPRARPRRVRACTRGRRADAGACVRGVRRALGKSRHAIDHIDHEMEAVEIVEHHHVERCRRRALFFVSAHVHVVVVRAPVGKSVDEPRVAVVGEDHRT